MVRCKLYQPELMGIFSSLFGKKQSIDFSELKKNGAIILDVRSPAEFRSGHINGALNIPLDKLSSGLGKLPKSKPVITCCASGMRSSAAAAQLKKAGYEAYNGGAWMSLKNKI